MTDYLRNSILVVAGWGLYLLVAIILGARFSNIYHLTYLFLMPSVFLMLTVLCFTFFSKKYKQGVKITVRKIIMLVILDQGIKLVVKLLNLETKNIKIIPNLIHIEPTFNTYGSYFGSLLEIDISNIFYLILYIIIMFICIEGYRFYVQQQSKSYWSSLVIILIMAGAIASSLDKIIWINTLDILHIKGLFVCDLKDFYLTLVEIFVIIEIINNPDIDFSFETNVEEDIEFFKTFFNFIKEDIKGIY